MPNYSLMLTFTSVINILKMFLDIFIIWILLYYLIRIIRNNSRTSQIFKGIVLVILIDLFAKFLGLTAVGYIADIFVNWGFLAIIIVFQPEIRSLLEKIGKTNLFSRMNSLSMNEKNDLVKEIIAGVNGLARNQVGALICIEQSQSLADFINTGIPINSVVTGELLATIFTTTTPLHDGAVIIQGDKIACASAYFPPTNQDVSNKFGARHRAALGISEITDSVTITVSEETGGVTVAHNGHMRSVNKKELQEYLMRILCGEVTDIVVEDDEEEKEKKKEKRFDTAILSKLAIRTHIEKLEKEELKEKIEEPVQPVEDEVVEIQQFSDDSESFKMPKPKKKTKESVPYEFQMQNVRVMGVEQQQNAQEVETPVEIQEKQFDASTIDINKLMGFKDDLDSKIAMVDEVAFSDIEEITPSKNSDKEGQHE